MKSLIAAILRDIAEYLEPKRVREFEIKPIDGRQIVQAIRKDQRGRGIA